MYYEKMDHLGKIENYIPKLMMHITCRQEYILLLSVIQILLTRFELEEARGTFSDQKCSSYHVPSCCFMHHYSNNMLRAQNSA
jgi:hypothetical protein